VVNTPQSAKELEAVRPCLAHNRPFGDAARTATRLGLRRTLRSEGRRRKPEN
jgi:hypothetical protein